VTIYFVPVSLCLDFLVSSRCSALRPCFPILRGGSPQRLGFSKRIPLDRGRWVGLHQPYVPDRSVGAHPFLGPRRQYLQVGGSATAQGPARPLALLFKIVSQTISLCPRSDRSIVRLESPTTQKRLGFAATFPKTLDGARRALDRFEPTKGPSAADVEVPAPQRQARPGKLQIETGTRV